MPGNERVMSQLHSWAVSPTPTARTLEIPVVFDSGFGLRASVPEYQMDGYIRASGSLRVCNGCAEISVTRR